MDQKVFVKDVNKSRIQGRTETRGKAAVWRARRELNPGPPGFFAMLVWLKARCSILTELRALPFYFALKKVSKGVL